MADGIINSSSQRAINTSTQLTSPNTGGTVYQWDPSLGSYKIVPSQPDSSQQTTKLDPNTHLPIGISPAAQKKIYPQGHPTSYRAPTLAELLASQHDRFGPNRDLFKENRSISNAIGNGGHPILMKTGTLPKDIQSLDPNVDFVTPRY